MRKHTKDLERRLENAVHRSEGSERRSFLHGEGREVHLLHSAEGKEESITHHFEGALHHMHFGGNRRR
jgi:hypothetical protein